LRANDIVSAVIDSVRVGRSAKSAADIYTFAEFLTGAMKANTCVQRATDTISTKSFMILSMSADAVERALLCGGGHGDLVGDRAAAGDGVCG
jgi:hypothetical protein